MKYVSLFLIILGAPGYFSYSIEKLFKQPDVKINAYLLIFYTIKPMSTIINSRIIILNLSLFHLAIHGNYKDQQNIFYIPRRYISPLPR